VAIAVWSQNDRRGCRVTEGPYSLALPVVGGRRPCCDDLGNQDRQFVASQLRPCLFQPAVDRHRPLHGIYIGSDPAAGRHFGPSRDRASPDPAHLISHADAFYHFGTTGWFLAVELGYTALDWPQFGWVAAALLLVTLMTVQGLGFLLPVNLFVCLELQKNNPDMLKITSWMKRYFYAVATQGAMQVAIIFVMTRFRAGI
jgi:hypothetical protein